MNQPSPNATSLMPRLAYLDALRGFAALYVVVYHVSLMPKPALAMPGWLKAFVGFGGSGVTLFFIISGFSMCLSWKRHAAAASPARSFYLNRLIRIAPLFYFWLVLAIIRDLVFKGPAGQHGLVEVGANALFLFNLYEPFQLGIVWASWTIGVEMLFYALFPLIKRAGFDTPAKTALLLALSLALIVMTRPQLVDGASGQPFFRTLFDGVGFFFVLPVFLMGVVAYHAHAALQTLAPGRLRKWLAVLLLVPAVTTLALLIAFRPDGVAWYYAAGIAYGLLLLAFAAFQRNALVNPLTCYLGKISYSLYLNHPTLVYVLIPFYLVVYGLGLGKGLAFCACVAVTLGVLVPTSHLTFRFIEAPAMAWAKRRERR